MLDVTSQLRDTIQAAGLIPPTAIEADGKPHRFATNDERGDDAGEYCLYMNGIPAGYFKDYRDGIFETWRADVGRKPTPAEEADNRKKLAAMNRLLQIVLQHSLNPILCIRRLRRLPLHIARTVRATALQWRDVINNIPRTSAGGSTC